MLKSLKNDIIWKRALKRSLPFILCGLFILSCGQRKSKLVQRAESQFPVSFVQEMTDYDPNAHDWTFKDIKTIYENDSICMLQFIVCYYDGGNIYRERDYRYTYLIDTWMSHFEHRPVFCERFQNILCLPDDLIKESRRLVKENNESVYDQAIGKTIEVKQPYDASRD